MKTKRIYYGPEGHELNNWWTVKVSPARKSITMNGDVAHALKAFPGVTVGCGLSRMATDTANMDAIGYKVYLASFTKSRAYLVDRLRANGEPLHAVEYAHSYNRITERNDDGTLKKMVRDDPSLIQRPFTLRIPPSSKDGRKTGPNSGKKTGTGHGVAFVPRGALARAMKAGRIGKNVAAQITMVAKSS